MTAREWALLTVLVLAAAGVAAVIAVLIRDAREERKERVAFTGVSGPPATPPRHAAAPPPQAHEEYTCLAAPPPLAGVPVPKPRERHEPVPLPALPLALGALCLLTAALKTAVPAAVAEMERLEAEAAYPHLRSGQYEDREWLTDSGIMRAISAGELPAGVPS